MNHNFCFLSLLPILLSSVAYFFYLFVPESDIPLRYQIPSYRAAIDSRNHPTIPPPISSANSPSSTETFSRNKPIANMGGQPNLLAFPDVDKLAPTLRTYILQAQTAGLHRHDSFKVAVSGGSLPKTLAKALLAPATSAEEKLQFDKWEIFFADERAVPLDHEDSNYCLLKAELLDKIPAELGQPKVHTINTDLLDDVQEMADQYEKLLVESFAARDSVKLPIFDLLLLGCGPDGHTCSLFPGHELLRETDCWVAPIEDSPKPPAKRITLTLPVVTHGVKIAFVATGGGKKEIMKQIFEGGGGLPCTLVNEGGLDRVTWFTDSPAVEGVSFPRRGSL
ncbi:NagB/RpiA/CoA transferase-like protein [Glarea lozoyensis ATCC 20868]|uniref:6-phosphogluconolactonase n=2 Tax=Glarea lozoyensis TaxID=101852 RepID=S3DYS5_GLAL2|nr:NagB/RpiA/CoA transferase-like protein [Glarea lozoyensis ATCC 20868]EPE37091.1 NagB/RpiA/CoA transferase-like protein [Glarea lozoyensis ATCC 20868]